MPCTTVSASGFACSREAAAPRWRGSRPWDATVGWSYSLLTGAERLLLGRLSVFAGSFDLDAAEAVCGFAGIEACDVAGLLGSLVDKSLVVAEPTGGTFRYRLLETIRQFAAERLAEAGEEPAAAVTAAHCQYYLAAAEGRRPTPDRAGPGPVAHSAGHRAGEPAARRPARQRQCGRDRAGSALRCCAPALLVTRSRHEGGLGLLLPVLDRPAARADPALFGPALLTAADLAERHDMALARRLGEQAVAFARQRGDDRLLIDSLTVLGGTYCFAGEPGRGLPLAEEAAQRARRLGDDVLLGWSLVVFLMCIGSSEPARSDQLFGEAIACADRSGDQLLRFALHNNASVYFLDAGDIPAARAHLEQAGDAALATGTVTSNIPVNLGWVLRQEHDLDGARDQFEEALRVSRRTGEPYGIAAATLGLACVAADLADWDRAAKLHGVAQALLDRTGLPREELEARYRRDSLHKVRTSLGEQQYERVYATGRALSLDQALDLALARTRPA